ncbi:MAG: aminoglycoside phosphotransferase family protein [Oscillospiraceae bacterium]|nr:aminoglycoside phosphotransferase family protein [Oscillospiraceae bacterium]
MDIKEIIESEFDLSVHHITVLGQGLDSIAYLVNNEYIFKRSKHDEARNDMKKEIQILDYIKNKVTLQIPEIEYYSEEYSICGYKEIKGDKLTPEIYKNMSDDEKDKLAKDIALFLREMHSIPLPDFDGSEWTVNVTEDYKSDHDALRKMIYDKIPDRSKEYLDNLYKRILNDERITKYVKALCHNDLGCNHMIIQNNNVVGIIDFGDAAVTDRDKDFIYLLENSPEEIGREFGLKVLEYYNYPNKDIPILKADLNDEYYPIEQVIGGYAIGSDNMYHEGLNKIINI